MNINSIKTFLLLYLCSLISFFNTSGQSNFIVEMSGPMTLDTNSAEIYYYRIPNDTVKQYVKNERAIISPNVNEAWLQTPTYRIPVADQYKYYHENTMTPGYYLVVSAVAGEVRAYINEVEGFHSSMRSLGLIKLLDIKDFEGNVLKDISVTANGQRITFDPIMQSYVIRHGMTATIEVVAENKDYISFWTVNRYKEYDHYLKHPKRTERDERKEKKKRRKNGEGDYDNVYYSDYDRNQDEEEKKKEKTAKPKLLKGYLVTNKPKYLPGDTIKFKAWIENPEHKPLSETMNLSLVNDGYERFVLFPALKAIEPGLYYGEYVIGDSITTGITYRLSIKNPEKFENDLSTSLKVEDYLLDDFQMTLKTKDKSELQIGDSADLFAYAFTSNKLPVMQGFYVRTITGSIIHGLNKAGAYYVPPVLYRDTIQANPTGETNLGFTTRKLDSVAWELSCQVAFFNANFERKIATQTFKVSASPYIFKQEINGNTIKVSVVKNKKEIVGYNGRYSISSNSMREKTANCTFPFTYTIARKERIYITADGVQGRVAFNESTIKTGPDIYEEYQGDTAVVTFENTHNIHLRFAVYLGQELSQTFSINTDTVLRFVNPKGQTITLKGCASFGEELINHRIYYWPKELQLQINKKDFVFPGQKDTIQLQLSAKNKVKLPRTNVTVLAFNGKFSEDFVPQLLQESNVDHGIDAIAVYDRSNNYDKRNRFRYQLAIPTTMEWLKKCGADTMFFYKNMCILPDGIKVLQQPNNNPLLAELAIYIRDSNKFYLPEIVWKGEQPHYINGISSVNPQGFFVPEWTKDTRYYNGDHSIKVRTHKALYELNRSHLEQGKKTTIFINADTNTLAYLPWEKRPDSVKKNHYNFTIIKHSALKDSLSETEAKNLSYYVTEFELQELHHLEKISVHQYPVSIMASHFKDNTANQPYRELSRNTYSFFAGPIYRNEIVCFWQNNFNHSCFLTAAKSSYLTNDGKVSSRNNQVQEHLGNLKLQCRRIMPSMNILLPKPENWQQIVNKEDSLLCEPETRTIITPILKNQSRYERNSKYLNLTVHKNRFSSKYFVVYKEGDTSSVHIFTNGMYHSIYSKPGKYRLLAIDDRNQKYELTNVELRANGQNIVYMDSTLKTGTFDFKNPPATLKHFIGEHKREIKQELGWWRRGNISGKITDTNGRPLADVLVRLLAKKKSSYNRYYSDAEMNTSNTNSNGEYSFNHLLAGDYDLTFTAPAFVSHKCIGIEVTHNKTTYVNRNLVLARSHYHEPMAVDTSEKVRLEYEAKRRKNESDGYTTSQFSRSPSRNMEELRPFSQTSKRKFEDEYGKKEKQVSGLEARQSKSAKALSASEEDALLRNKVQSFITELMNNPLASSGIRKDFRDWAIWEPNLWTNNNGEASFAVQYPGNITSWKTYFLAMNKEGYSIRSMNITRAFKAITAELLAPRFLRYGDKVELIGKASNFTNNPIIGTRKWSLNSTSVVADSGNLQYATSDFKYVNAPLNNSLDTVKLEVGYSIEIPNGYTDGELRNIPVYPLGVTENYGQSFVLDTDTVLNIERSKDMDTFQQLQTRIYIDGDNLEGMLRQIENLKTDPHGCVEQMTSKLIAINYEEKLKKLIKGSVPNNTKTKAEIISKLIAAQNTDGSYGWWQNNNADIRITNYVTNALIDANIDSKLNDAVRKSLQFLRSHLDSMSKEDKLISLKTLATNNYIDNSKGAGIVKAMDTGKGQYLFQKLSMLELKKRLNMSYKNDLDSVAKIFQKDWDEREDYYRYDWYRNDAACYLLAYKLFKEDEAYKHLAKKIKIKLLCPRNHYEYNTANTSMILQTFIPEYLNGKEKLDREKIAANVELTTSEKVTFQQFPAFKSFNLQNKNYSIKKTGLSPIYVRIVHDYFNANPKAKDSGFQVSTQFLSETKVPLTILEQGQKVILRVSVTIKKPAEYFMIETPIPAGCIPISNIGRHYYNNYYESSREEFRDKVCIFSNHISNGKFQFDILLDCRFKGTFNVNPARACLMYFPNVYGISDSKTIEIK